jgi:hypothetical protein
MSAGRLAARLTGELLAVKGNAAPTSRPLRVWSLPAAAPQPAGAPPVREEAAAPDQPPGEAGEATARFSVRLDPDRHLRLKLMAAHSRRSRQDIVVAAIDRYLAELGPLARGGCGCLAPAAAAQPGPCRLERQD